MENQDFKVCICSKEKKKGSKKFSKKTNSKYIPIC